MKLFSTNVFLITALIISYIPGLMTAPGLSNDLYLFWIAFLAYLAAVTNEINCYTLGDNEARKKRLIVDYSVAWPLIVASLNKNLAAPEVLVPIVLILWIVVLKLRERSRALMFATNSNNGLARGSKIISDLATFHNYEACDDDQPRNISYNRFLVGVREAQNKLEKEPQSKRMLTSSRFIDFDPSNLITLDKVLTPNDPFLANTTEGKELQNICYSFSMFWLLLAKVAGYNNVDVRIKLPDKPLEFVERELEFLYEYLFTNYFVIYERSLWKKVRDVCILSLFLWLTIPLLVEYRPQDHNIVYVILWKSVLDTGFTRFVILAIITIEFTQIGIFLTSKWAKVMYTCAYLQNKTPWGSTRSRSTPSNLLLWLIRLACHLPRLSLLCSTTVTKRKIGQYSILSCYCKIPMTMWFKCWIGSYFELSRMGQAGNTTVDLSLDLQNDILKAIETCLVKHDGKFSNGVCSLKENNVDDDVVSVHVMNMKSQARMILVWHIATSLIEEDTIEAAVPNLDKDHHFQASSTISKYCEYLVAFAPQVLADHVYTTKCEFDDAVKELERETIRDDDDTNQGLTRDNYSVLQQARELKDKLKQQPDNLWKTLAEFWTGCCCSWLSRNTVAQLKLI